MAFKQQKTNVLANNYQNKVEVISPDLVRFYRNHKWSPGQDIVDAFGRYWSLSFIDGDKYHLTLERDGKEVSLKGGRGFFLPNYSLIKWRIYSEEINWVGYFSDEPMPSIPIVGPVTFDWDKVTLPNSIKEVEELLINSTPFKAVGLTAQCDISRKTKKAIDESYLKNLDLNALSKELGTAQEVMNRKFKASFGITPIQYKNKLRITDSTVELMTSSRPVSSIAHNLGFNDISFFNKVFKREYSTRPSNFRKKNEIDS